MVYQVFVAVPVHGNTLQTIIDDMQLTHEAFPHGVPPDSDFMAGPKLLVETTPPAGWSAMTAWGQVYRDVSDSQDSNTRIQIRNIGAYLLSRSTGQWSILQSSVSVDSGSWPEDYAGKPIPSNVVNKADGSIAVKLNHGRNLLFWPMTSRASLEPDDIAGLFTTVQARLTVDNPALRDDTAVARYLIDMGADYWINLVAHSTDYNIQNTPIGYGRLRYVTTTWQDYNFTTLSPEAISANPPPFGVAATIQPTPVPAPPPNTTPVPAPLPTPNTTPNPVPTPMPTLIPAPLPIPTHVDTVQMIISDMGTSDAWAHGMNWSQKYGGKVHSPAGQDLPGGWNAGIGWGQIYRDVSDSQDGNTRIALKDFKVYILSKSTGQWRLVQDSALEIEHFPETYVGDPRPADVRTEPDGSLSDKLIHGFNAHFFPIPRFSMENPLDFGGFYAKFQARKIVDDPHGADDRDVAKYLINVGGDWWKTIKAPYAGLNGNNTEIGYSRLKYVSNDWQTIRFTTLTPEQVRQNPPPQ